MGIVYRDISVSADRYATGLEQREKAPFGDIDETWLHGWMFDAYDENRAEVDAIVDLGCHGHGAQHVRSGARRNDGSAHLHLWAYARPAGMMQRRGAILPYWEQCLPASSMR